MCLGTTDQLLVDDAVLPMHACTRFDSCNANVCPLDPQWRLACHLKNEPVCPFVCQRARGTYTGAIGTGEVVVNMDAILKSSRNIAKRAAGGRLKSKSEGDKSAITGRDVG